MNNMEEKKYEYLKDIATVEDFMEEMEVLVKDLNI